MDLIRCLFKDFVVLFFLLEYPPPEQLETRVHLINNAIIKSTNDVTEVMHNITWKQVRSFS